MTTAGELTASGKASRDARAAARVGAGIFLSRLLGFVRDRLVAYFFGTSDFADAWRAALRLPNVVQNLLGEGTLSASLIPVYAELHERGRHDEARAFAGAALGILAVVAGGLAFFGAMLAPVLVRVLFFAWSPEKREITTSLVVILFPMTGVLVIAAWALGILNSHRHFFVSYVSSAFWNLAMIAALVAGGVYLSMDGRDLVIALAWGALVGGVLQLGVQLPLVFKHLGAFRVSLGRGVVGVDEAVRGFWPVVAARGAVNISAWVDVVLAAQLAGGAIAVMGYAQTFYMLPISLFGMSVAAAELPELSRRRGDANHVKVARVSAALRRVSYFLIPSALVYLFAGDVVIAALYQTGEFGSAETLVTWAVLAAYALGLPASGSSRVLSSAFYALRDTRTPARIAGLRVVISAVIGVALMFPLDGLGFSTLRAGAAGLAFGASSAAWLEYVLLRRALGRAIGAHGPGIAPIVRTTLAGALACAAAVGLQGLVGVGYPPLVALETLVPSGVVYLVAAWLLGERAPAA